MSSFNNTSDDEKEDKEEKMDLLENIQEKPIETSVLLENVEYKDNHLHKYVIGGILLVTLGAILTKK